MRKLWCFFGVHEWQPWEKITYKYTTEYTAKTGGDIEEMILISTCKVCGKLHQVKLKTPS